MKYLLDTNVILNFFKGINPDSDFVELILGKDEVYFSPIVIAEIIAGSNKVETMQLAQLIEFGKILTINDKTGVVAGNYRKKLSQKTTKVYLLDCFIAAHAKINKLTLVTNNIKDYKMKDINIVKP